METDVACPGGDKNNNKRKVNRYFMKAFVLPNKRNKHLNIIKKSLRLCYCPIANETD